MKDDILNFIEPVDIKGMAFTWDPKLVDQAEGLEVILDIVTIHSCGHPALFKPSIQEVLAQIPEDIASKVVAFETFLEFSGVRKNMTDDGVYHKAKTILYTGSLPQSIKDQPVILDGETFKSKPPDVKPHPRPDVKKFLRKRF